MNPPEVSKVQFGHHHCHQECMSLEQWRSREVRLWKSGKYLLNSPSKASRCWLGNQVLRSSITLLYNFWHCLQHCQVSHSNFASPILHLTNESFDFVHKIDYQASFPLEFQVQCVQLPKYVNIPSLLSVKGDVPDYINKLLDSWFCFT